MTRTIKALVCRVGEDPRVEECPEDLGAWQKLVDGYIQVVHLDDGVLLVCNEEGQQRRLPFNGFVPGRAPKLPPEFHAVGLPADAPDPGEFGVHVLLGNFALVRYGEGDYEPLVDRDVMMWLPVLLRRMTPSPQ